MAEMPVGITQAQQRILELPFPLSAHGFVNKQPYLRKDAIRTRLSAVDPAWTMTQPQLVGESGDAVMFVGGLAVCGVLRWGLGTGIIQQLEPRKGEGGMMIDPSPFEIARTVANAHKKAEKDVLPRAAIEFGVGAYLKRVPKGTGTPQQLEAWLRTLTPHWSTTEVGARVRELVNELGLGRDVIAMEIEPGRVLAGLWDTWLTYQQFVDRLHALAAEYEGIDAATEAASNSVKP